MISKACIKCLPPLMASDQLLAAPTEEQHPTQNINSTFFNYTKEEKHFTFFGQYTLRHENEISKFPGEGRKITVKSIP